MREPVRETQDRWAGSRALLERAKSSLAGGVSSPFRAKAPVPLYFENASGSRLEDVDGNTYIDWALAWGPLILGHCHPAIVTAMQRQAERPHAYGAQHRLEFEVAEKITTLVPCAERVAFTSSGSEAVQIALRLARAFTSRRLIVKFEGHYHGWLDSVLISYHPAPAECGPPDAPAAVPGSRGQSRGAMADVLVLPWNSVEALDRTFGEHGSEIAAVITEPVLCNSGCLLPDSGYLATLRRYCSDRGALLIFDEVITGFRMGPGGAQQHFTVLPDLVTLGKALGGGLPVSAMAGREDVLSLMFGGGVAFGGTFNGNPVSLAAASAAIDELSRDDGRTLQAANALGRRLMAGLAARAQARDIPLTITGFGTAFSLHFTNRRDLRTYRDVLEDDAGRLASFLKAALDEGLYLLPDGRIYVSIAHTDADVEATLQAADRAFARL